MDTIKRRVATRSPVALARTALQVARQAIPAYSSKFSKKDFTQHQLLAVLALALPTRRALRSRPVEAIGVGE